MKFFPCFLHFSPIWIKFGTDDHNNLLSDFEFYENHYFTCQCKWIAIHTCHVYCPFWVKFSIRDMRIVVLSICEIHENWPRKCCTFLMGINDVTCTCVCCQVIERIDSKQSWCKICVLHHKVHPMQSDLLTEEYRHCSKMWISSMVLKILFLKIYCNVMRTEYTCRENPEVDKTSEVNGESPFVPTVDYIALLFFVQSILTSVLWTLNFSLALKSLFIQVTIIFCASDHYNWIMK
jgi:hypothetical protein